MTNKEKMEIEKWSRQVLLMMGALAIIAELALAAVKIPDPPAFTRERYATRLYSNVPPVEVSIINWQISNFLTSSPKADVLFLGDSSCLMGIKPKVVESKIGRKCWNAGTIGFLGSSGHALIFEQWLKHVGAPQLLVYHIVPYTISTGAAQCSTYGQPLRDWLSGSTQSGNFYDLLPTSMARRYCQWWLSSLCRKFASDGKYMNQPRQYYPSDNDIAAILKENQGWMPEFKPQTRWQDNPPLELKPFNKDCLSGLQSIFRQAQVKNCKVLVVMHAVPDIYDNEKTRTAYAGYESGLHDAAAPFANVQIASPFLQFYPAGLCANITHLTRDGAVVHSNDISELISRIEKASPSRLLAGSRTNAPH